MDSIEKEIGNLSINKPSEPDHPMLLDGRVIPGDTVFMVRCLFEEMLFAGLTSNRLMEMSHSPYYQGLYAARTALGDSKFNEILHDVSARIGVHQVRVSEVSVDQRVVFLDKKNP